MFKNKKAFPNSIIHKLLVEVDGTLIQTFTLEGKDIDVYDDYEVGAVYIKSEIKLNDIIKYKSEFRERK